MHLFVGDDNGRSNGERFVTSLGIRPAQTLYQRVEFGRDDYCQYSVVDDADAGRGFDGQTLGDGLATSTPGIAIYLPLADCVGAIIFDEASSALMVSHLGRQSSQQFGARRSVEFIAREFGSNPSDLLVWLSPSPNGRAYPLWSRENRSLRDVTLIDLRAAGVRPQHIEVCDVDTVVSDDYFSHSEFLRGNRDLDGRYAIVAILV